MHNLPLCNKVPVEPEGMQADDIHSPARRFGGARRLWLHGRELVGAFADLGTFLPLILGVLVLRQFDPVGVLVGFGLFALTVAFVYRRPVPVQPMKAVAALVLAGGLPPAVVAATGLLLGVTLLGLAGGGFVDRLARVVPETVLIGVQVGLGLFLAGTGAKLVFDAPVVGSAALFVLTVAAITRFRVLGGLLVLAGAVGYGVATSAEGLPAISVSWHLPSFALPGPGVFESAIKTAYLPQLALTLTNAIIVTASFAALYFPDDAERISPRKLALSTGALNLCLAPFGAFPMCHGAGGLAVQYRFGARTGLAPAVFGVTCLTLGVGLGTNALPIMQIIPLAAVGALLVMAGIELAATGKPRAMERTQIAVVALTALVCVLVNIPAGLLAGILAEWLMKRFAHSGTGYG
jgi:hypothetical protein